MSNILLAESREIVEEEKNYREQKEGRGRENEERLIEKWKTFESLRHLQSRKMFSSEI